jgi:hypothetical protein
MDDVADDPNAKDHERLLAYLLRSLDALTAGSARTRPIPSSPPPQEC